MTPLRPRHALIITLAVAGLGTARAQGGASQPLWEVGAVAVGVSQQAYPGAGQTVERGLALPYFIYRGRVLRADRDTAGLRAIRTETFELDLGVAAAFAARSDRIDARRGMPDLGTLVEFGPRGKWDLGTTADGGRWTMEVPLRAVLDLNDGLAYKGLAFEPRLVRRQVSAGGTATSVSVSAIMANAQLADTLYGVAPAFAQAGRPAYKADSGLVAWRAAASISHRLTADWSVFGYARLDTVAGAANEASPLVRSTTGRTVGIGMAYTWMRSAQPAAD